MLMFTFHSHYFVRIIWEEHWIKFSKYKFHRLVERAAGKYTLDHATARHAYILNHSKCFTNRTLQIKHLSWFTCQGANHDHHKPISHNKMIDH